MALAVEAAFEARSTLLVEAGTGVGKSFAYLVPAIARALGRGERVVVATNTIALQEQLVEKDIPLLASTIGERSSAGDGEESAAWSGQLRPVLVKGRGNYLSIRRLALASARQGALLSDEAQRVSLRVIEDWAYETSDGTLSTLPAIDRSDVWDLVRSDSDNCMGRKCPRHEQCFYQSARRAAERANLLICNHALYFADLALRASGASILPKYDQVILDEAHQIEDVASEHFGVSLTQGRVAFLLRSLYDRRRRKGYLAQLEAQPMATEDQGAVRAAIEATLTAMRVAGDFFDGWIALVESGGLPGGRVRQAGLVDDTLTPVMRDLSLRLAGLKDAVRAEEDRFELNAYAKRAADIAQASSSLVEQSIEHCAYWAQVSRSRGRPRATIACAPIEVASVLKEQLFGRDWGVVLTSATLCTRRVEPDEPTERAETAFAHLIDRLGCAGATTLQLGSPFDHAEQVELFVDRSMPRPTAGQGYADELVPRILDHVIATDGGAFVLFTSFDLLRRVGDRLAGPLAELDMPLLVHGSGGSRRALLESFRAHDRSVLLGADSFWQGVDIRGRGLRNVILTRLPFEPPDRPLTEARAELIRQRGGNPFREDSIPRAVIRFKQGFGRLIRSGQDRGRVVVLDPRIVTARYGKFFRDALPPGVGVRTLGS